MPHIMKKKPTEMSKAVPGDVHNIVTLRHKMMQVFFVL